MTKKRVNSRQGRPGDLLGDDDLALWRYATRHDRPLRASRTLLDSDEEKRLAVPDGLDAQLAPKPQSEGPRRQKNNGPAKQRQIPLPTIDPNRPAGIDKRTVQRLRKGRLPIDDRLDLHGMTQARAHQALKRFIHSASETGNRCVLIITGKGSRPDGGVGVLRSMVPRWLNEGPIRDKVLTFRPAHVQHGGDGALYVMLRRRR